MKKIAALFLILSFLLCGIAAADDVEAGLLRTAIHYDIRTMDVARTSDDYMIPMNVFDRLFETRPGKESSEIVKSLITDYSVSEDGKTYSFTLREGIVFSNGSALTASDVQYSFERLLKIGDQNTDIPLEVVGGKAVLDKQADSLEGFKVTDDLHFSITLEAPNAGFPAELSAPAMSIVDKETVEKAAAFGTEPADTVGTGPYIVTEWVSGDHYTLVYNEKYWGPEPSVKKLIVKTIDTASTRSMKFNSGELDIVDLQGMDSIVVDSTFQGKPIVSTPKVGLTYLLLNENQKYLKDVKVRKAIGMAINVDEIIQGVFMGNAQRENGIIPTGVWGHNSDLKGFTYDPEGAKALLKEAGYAEGEVTFELAMNSTKTTDNDTLVYNTISSQLKKVGITANIVSYEDSMWAKKRNSGEMESFVATWGMDYNDPANIMDTFFGSVANTKGRSLNYPDTKTIDRVAAARAIVDDDARKAEYQALEKQLLEDEAVWIPMYAELHRWCLGLRVESFTPQWAGFTDFYVADVKLK